MSNRPTPPSGQRGLLVIGGAGPAPGILAAMALDDTVVINAGNVSVLVVKSFLKES